MKLFTDGELLRNIVKAPQDLNPIAIRSCGTMRLFLTGLTKNPPTSDC
jgi:hypothetical protein